MLGSGATADPTAVDPQVQWRLLCYSIQNNVVMIVVTAGADWARFTGAAQARREAQQHDASAEQCGHRQPHGCGGRSLPADSVS